MEYSGIVAQNRGGGASFLPILSKRENTGCHLSKSYADILIFANLLPKIEKEKWFTIIYADIFIFANANVVLNEKSWLLFRQI